MIPSNGARVQSKPSSEKLESSSLGAFRATMLLAASPFFFFPFASGQTRCDGPINQCLSSNDIVRMPRLIKIASLGRDQNDRLHELRSNVPVTDWNGTTNYKYPCNPDLFTQNFVDFDDVF